MIERSDLRAARVFVGLKGVDVECVTPDGQIQWVLGLPAGVHSAENLMPYMAPGDVLRLNGGATVLYRGGRVVSQSFGAVAFQSGANPDFRPSVYTEAEMRMRKLVDQANQAEKRMEKRMRAMQAAKELADPPVIEPVEPVEPVKPVEPVEPVKEGLEDA